MNTKKLTDEEKTKVFAMYLECQMSFNRNEDENTLLLSTADIMANEIGYFDVEDNMHYSETILADWHKLILTPFGKISDEDAMQVARMNRFDRGDDIAKQKVGRDFLRGGCVCIFPNINFFSFFFFSFSLKKPPPLSFFFLRKPLG